MSPERVADLVLRWVRFYTRALPASIAERRLGEIEADLHDHAAYERAQGTSDRRTSVRILSRMARGLPADVWWRRRNRTQEGSIMKLVLTILGVALVVAIGVAAIVYGESDDSPGLQGIGVLLVAGAVALSVRTARRRPSD